MLSDSVRSISEAAALERELLDEYRFGWQQLVELCGHGSAVAVAKVLAPFARGYFNSSLRFQAHCQTRQKWGPQTQMGEHLQGGAWVLELQAWVP